MSYNAANPYARLGVGYARAADSKSLAAAAARLRAQQRREEAAKRQAAARWVGARSTAAAAAVHLFRTAKRTSASRSLSPLGQQKQQHQQRQQHQQQRRLEALTLRFLDLPPAHSTRAQWRAALERPSTPIKVQPLNEKSAGEDDNAHRPQFWIRIRVKRDQGRFIAQRWIANPRP